MASDPCAPRTGHAFLMSVLALLGGAGAASPQPPPEPVSVAAVQKHYDDAIAAYAKRDYAGYLSGIEQALRLLPSHPALVYRIAGGYALNKRPEEALAALERFVSMKVARDLEANPDFIAIRQMPRFAAALEAMKKLHEPIGSSREAFRLAQRDFIPEGITRDPKSGTLYVGSVRQRTIARVRPDGTAGTFAEPKKEGLGAVLGMGVDASRRLLHACSSDMKFMIEADPNRLERGTLFSFDLESGSLARKVALGGGAAGHSCNDLTVAPDGTVYISDDLAREVVQVAPGAAEPRVLVDAGRLGSPQGLALSEDGAALLIADYSSGLWRLTLAGGTLSLVALPPHVPSTGIDGLARAGTTLLAIQNGITPHRVVRLTMDPTASSVLRGDILEMNNPLFSEPTLGVVADDGLFYVANSQWGAFKEDGSLPDAEKLTGPIILKLPLK